MVDFTIEGRGRYFVLRDGVQVSGPHSMLIAQDKRDALERAEKHNERTCMRCKAVFLSEGNHNRMCRLCRGHSNPFGGM